MKHFYVLLLAFLIIQFPLKSQDLRKVDSLISIVSQAEPEDRATVYEEISLEIVSVDYDLGIAYADSAVLFAELFNDLPDITRIYVSAGSAYQVAYKDQDALDFFRKALSGYEKLDDRAGVPDALYHIGRSFYWQNMYDSSFFYFEEVEKIVNVSGDQKLYSDILIARSDNYRRMGDMTNSLLLLNEAKLIKQELDDYDGLNDVYSSMAAYNWSLGNYEAAALNYQEAKKYRLLLGRRLGAAIMVNNAANCYVHLGENAKAIDSYEYAINIYKEYNNQRGIANAYNGMAVVYEKQKQYDKAKESLHENLEIYQTMGNQYMVAVTLNNLGILYSNIALDTIAGLFGQDIRDLVFEEPTDKYLDHFTGALDYFEQSLVIAKEIDDKPLTSKTLTNIGTSYIHSGKLDLAEDYIEQSIKVSREISDLHELANGYLNLGEISMHRGNYNLALKYFNQTVDNARTVNDFENQKSGFHSIHKVYLKLNNNRKALSYYKLYINMKDSITDRVNRDLLEQHEIQKEREFERTEQMIANMNQLWEQDKELQSSRLRIQMIIIISFSLLLVLALVSSFYIYRAFKGKQKAFKLLTRQKQEIETQRDEIGSQRDEIVKQKDLLTHQKDQLEEQKQSLTDSINYASKIQSAIIPSDELLRHYMPKHFVLFKPRDIVSGDFYWIGAKENKVILAAVDCTGHGVPGAFMSVMGSSQLNEIMGRIQNVQSNDILDELRDLIIISLRQSGRSGEAKDGMDMTLCIFDFKNKTLQFSGAHNPLYLVRDNELIEYKGDKMPIGIHIHAGKPFTKTDISLKKGDAIYLFSDGYADQFGGPRGKKFKYSQFKSLLLEIQDNIMYDQKEILEEKLNDWMMGTDAGDEQYEQVDDILVMGIKI